MPKTNKPSSKATRTNRSAIRTTDAALVRVAGENEQETMTARSTTTDGDPSTSGDMQSALARQLDDERRTIPAFTVRIEPGVSVPRPARNGRLTQFMQSAPVDPDEALHSNVAHVQRLIPSAQRLELQGTLVRSVTDPRHEVRPAQGRISMPRTPAELQGLGHPELLKLALQLNIIKQFHDPNSPYPLDENDDFLEQYDECARSHALLLRVMRREYFDEEYFEQQARASHSAGPAPASTPALFAPGPSLLSPEAFIEQHRLTLPESQREAWQPTVTSVRSDPYFQAMSRQYQSAQLQHIQAAISATRPANTLKQYAPRIAEYKEWCARYAWPDGCVQSSLWLPSV